MPEELLDELKDIVEKLELISITFDRNKSRIREFESERNDLMHLAEFGKFNAYEGYCHFKRLGDISRERRVLKDQNEILQPFLGMAYKKSFQIGKMKEALKTSEQKINVQETRSYKVRNRLDLEDRINYKGGG